MDADHVREYTGLGWVCDMIWVSAGLLVEVPERPVLPSCQTLSLPPDPACLHPWAGTPPSDPTLWGSAWAGCPEGIPSSIQTNAASSPCPEVRRGGAGDRGLALRGLHEWQDPWVHSQLREEVGP